MDHTEAPEEVKPSASAMAAFSDDMPRVQEALDVLYIKGNSSGRVRFTEKWPDVAEYIFGEQLIKYDHEGCDDFDHRSELEEEANDRRLGLKQTLGEVVKKSVESAMLQTEYVGGVIDQYGGKLSKMIYAEDIIARVRPDVLKADQPEQQNVAPSVAEETPTVEAAPAQPEQDVAAVDDSELSTEERSILSNQDDAEDAPQASQPRTVAAGQHDSLSF